MIEISAAGREVLLAMADDEHLMGQQHTEWIGVAPFLEEDLAFASIGQDELGHAALLFEALTGNDDAAIDAEAFFREAPAWRSCALVEVNLADWSDTLVRHWLYDAAEELRWQLFDGSSEPLLSDIAERALSEERFHRRHADALLDTLLTVDDARVRLDASLQKLLPLALTLFDPVAGEPIAISEGIVTDSITTLLGAWKTRVDERFAPQQWADVTQPDHHGRTQRHDDFAPLLARMLEVFDLDRTAVW